MTNTILRFDTNTPVEVALRWDDGKRVEGRYGEQIMYTLEGDRSSVQSDRPARFAEHRTRARREPEPCSSGGSRSPALSIAHDCGLHADECAGAKRAL